MESVKYNVVLNKLTALEHTCNNLLEHCKLLN